MYVNIHEIMLRSISNSKISCPAVIWGTFGNYSLAPPRDSKDHDIVSSDFCHAIFTVG